MIDISFAPTTRKLPQQSDYSHGRMHGNSNKPVPHVVHATSTYLPHKSWRFQAAAAGVHLPLSPSMSPHKVMRVDLPSVPSVPDWGVRGSI